MSPQFAKCSLLPMEYTGDCNSITMLEQIWGAGTLLGWWICGGMMMLGVICFRQLGIHKGESSSIRTRLQCFIGILLTANTIFAGLNFATDTILKLIITSSSREAKYVVSIDVTSNVLAFCIATMCDVLLLWRCYRVKKLLVTGLTYCSLFQNIFLIFPLVSLCLLTFTSGITGSVLLHFGSHSFYGSTGQKLFKTALLSNIILNLLATFYLSIRLLIHRHMLNRSLGDFQLELGGTSTSGEHTRIIEILLESATLNIPITIAAVVLITQFDKDRAAAMPIIIPAQSFASILVIYQIANGRAIESVGSQVTHGGNTERHRMTNLSEQNRSETNS